jgi:hypothetical protein
LQRSYKKKLFNYVFEEFTCLYIQMIIFQAKSYKTNESPVYSKKINDEVTYIKNIFKEFVSKKVFEQNEPKLKAIQDVWQVDASEVMLHIATLRLALRSNFNDNCVKTLLRLRSDLTPETKQSIRELLKEKSTEIKIR